MPESQTPRPDKAIYMITGTEAERSLAFDAARPLLPDSAKARPPSVIHATVVLAGACDPRTVARAIQIGDLMRCVAFQLRFDTLEGFPGGAAALTCEAAPPGFLEARRQLSQTARSLGQATKGGSAPHLTVAYGCPAFAPVRLAEPLVWDATEIQLVRSVQGETRHEVLGRWRLS